MAIGDAAAAVGLTVFSPAADVNEGADNDNIRGDELASHIVDGTHPWTKITGKPSKYPAANDSVGTAQLKDGAVTGAKIKAQTIQSVNIAAQGVGTSEIRDYSVTTGKIADGAVNNRALGNRVVDTDNLALGSVYGGIIDNGGVEWASLSSHVQGLIQGTSSIRYKEDVVDAVLDPATILALRPVTYHRKSETTGERELGLIAEEVEEAGATDLVVWRNGVIDGVHYSRLPVALLAVVQDQQARINQLEERLSNLEGGA